MVRRLRDHLPSISVMLGVIGLVLVVPFAVVATMQLRSASSDVEAAEQVQESAQRLVTLVQLRPAIDAEVLAIGLTSGESVLFDETPSFGSLFGDERARPLDELQSEIDQLVDQLDDPELQQLVGEARSTIGNSVEGVLGSESIYDQVRSTISIEIEQEVVNLTSAAGATENDALSHAAQLAAGAADLQTTSSELNGLWAHLESSQFVTPTLDDVTRMSSGLANFEERSLAFDRLVPETGPIRESWDDVQASEQLARLLPQYQATVERFGREGLDANVGASDGLVDFSEITVEDLASIATIADRLMDGIADSDAVQVEFTELLDATINELSGSGQQALDDANQDRRITILAMIATSIFVIVSGLVAVLLISRPIKRLAGVTERVQRGDLSLKVPETGPREIRAGARAINEALASMRHVEDQAVALADDRLDDPVLRDAAPGALGTSLQVAVRRLADSAAEREEIQTRLEYEASHDSMTALPNRRALFERLHQRRAAGTPFALVFVDLADFKAINDSHGHYTGDHVLKTTATRLLQSMDPDAVVARLGGDEFVVVTETIETPDEAISIAERVQEAVAKPIDFEEMTITPRASIGVTMSDGTELPGEVLKNADLALSQSKGSENRSIVMADAALRSAADDRTELRNAIMQGIENDEFTLHFQSIVSATSTSVLHLEALVRWNRDSELVSPGVFIPIAESSELIIELDTWVLHEAAATIAANPSIPPIATNISARHVSSGRLVENVRSAISTHDIDPTRLIIEVTETALLDDFDQAEQDLAEVRSMGVGVALDDFGTGYMSLAYLRTFPVDTLKIDKSFIDEIATKDGRSIVQLIIDTAHLLSLSIVAEGVETQVQASLLNKMGADSLQGYWFDKPAPLSAHGESTTALAA